MLNSPIFQSTTLQIRSSMIRIAIVEDDNNIRNSLVQFLSSHASMEVVTAVDSMETFLKSEPGPLEEKPNILLLDIGLPGMSGLEGIAPARQKYPDIDIIMLTTFEDSEKIFQALCAGAKGYLSKRSSLATIAQTVITVNEGGSYMSPVIARKVVDYFAPRKKNHTLSDRQLQIVEGLKEGLSYKLIAARYMISINTVRDHIKKIYAALEVNSKAEIIRKSMNQEI